jgi:hypothetical protein
MLTIIYPASLAGRQRSGVDHGTIVHAKSDKLNFSSAVCGVSPSGKSNGWEGSHEPITCHKCLAKLKNFKYKIEFDDSMDVNF